MAQETLEFIGVRYPRGLERCQRLRAVLRDIYSREHDVCLDGLSGEGKREVRRYLDSLDGMVPYVASRLALLCFETHAMPVDDQLRLKLVEIGAADPDIYIAELTSWLEHHIKPSDGAATHHTLQIWVDGGGAKPRSPR
jgi:hypothetical protein